ncbi:MAG TPA: LCP family protein [Ornithinibacter sp.]|nr:LCP family protein [Ornithinibacter sp.]
MSSTDERLTPSPTGSGSDHSTPVTRRDIHRRPARRRLRLGVILVVAGLALGAGGSAFAAWRLDANISRIDVTAAIGTDRPTEQPGTADAVNLLLVGSDTREGEGNDAYADNDGQDGAQSDTNLLVHVSADRTSATVVSIPRDSMAPGPPACSPTAPKDQWVIRQWNQNYRKGGTGCLIRALEGNTGLRIDHYAVVDFRGFKQMVDALGGVEVCTTTAIDDSHTHLRLRPGRHTLDGRQALQYVRTRKSVGDGSDLGRITRQQGFLASVMQEATSTHLLVQPTRLYAFLDAATRSLTTDPELGVGTMSDLASSVKGIGLDEIQFVTVPNEPFAPDPNRVQWTASAEQIWSALREDRQVGAPAKKPAVTAPQESLTVSPADIPVDVVNATTVQGLARQARAALLVQGFTDVTRSTVAPAPAGQEGALVEYSGHDAEAARTVAAAFPGATVRAARGLGPRVRVTLGPGAPKVVEVPNRLGTTPLPTQSITASPAPVEAIETRKASTDICS